jgi:subtilisin family serine protease
MVHARLQAEHLEAFTSARARLAGTVRAAREARLLPMISAGNAGDRPYARHAPALLRGFDDGVRGLVKVAADKARLHDDDDVTASFSSPGDAVIAAPGEGIPVEVPPLGRTPQDVDGTSFSTAFVAGVIALMTKASPALTADEAELMLRATARNRRGAGKVGSVDPVAAVEAAWFRAATRRALFGARRSEGSGPVRE